jgi:hypothetical protein
MERPRATRNHADQEFFLNKTNMNMLLQRRFHSRNHENGQTILLVVVSIAVLLGMAALAIDIATLYTASNEARRTAQAAALAGAQAIASSGITSGYPLPQNTVCSNSVGSPGLAEQRALAMVAQNGVAGGAATLQATSCNFGQPTNPQFTVTVQRAGLPTFFGRIWGAFPGIATVSATAEAYNPSGTTGPPIAVGSVKPWAIPNCDPTPSNTTPANPSCGPVGSAGYFVDSSGGIAHAWSATPWVFDLAEVADNGSATTNWTAPAFGPNPPTVKVLAVDVPITAASTSCPAPGTLSCAAGSLTPSAPSFLETIACANSTARSYQAPINVLNVHTGGSTGSGIPSAQKTNAALCLIHAANTGHNQGQDEFCNNNPHIPSCPSSSPISIIGGSNNPDTLLQGQNNISRSDSVVTVPLFDPCAVPNCTNGSVTIVGFLQLGILQIISPGHGGPGTPDDLRVMVMNVVGRGGSTGTPVSGGGVSAVPVRVVQ